MGVEGREGLGGEVHLVGGVAPGEEGDGHPERPERVEADGGGADPGVFVADDERDGVHERPHEQERDGEVDDEGVDVGGPVGEHQRERRCPASRSRTEGGARARPTAAMATTSAAK